MATINTPLASPDMQDMMQKIQIFIDQLYDERIGGLLLGDVFTSGSGGDVLNLNTDEEGGLLKTGGKLSVKVNSLKGLKVDKDGLYILLRTGGGIAFDSTGALTTSAGVNADTLEGYHASQTPTANTVPVSLITGKIDTGWLNASVFHFAGGVPLGSAAGNINDWVAQGAGSLLNADMVDGKHAAEITGVQGPQGYQGPQGPQGYQGEIGEGIGELDMGHPDTVDWVTSFVCGGVS